LRSTLFNQEAVFLPRSVINWLGVDGRNPIIALDEEDNGNPFITLDEENGYPVFATHANDRERWDFNKIADEIEKYYKLNEDD